MDESLIREHVYNDGGESLLELLAEEHIARAKFIEENPDKGTDDEYRRHLMLKNVFLQAISTIKAYDGRR